MLRKAEVSSTERRNGSVEFTSYLMRRYGIA
jgi:hypothetical protein